jgi:hypothetical protein
MKPFIYLSIALGGFATAIGTGAIVSAEYHIAKTGQQAVAMILAPRVYGPMNLTRDDNASSDQVASDLQLDFAPNKLASLSTLPEPDVDIKSLELNKLEANLQCAMEQLRLARREQSRASRHTPHTRISVPVRPMVASYAFSIPTPMTASKNYTFMNVQGKPLAFHVDPKFAQFKFDTKKFDASHAQFVLQMKADKHVWESMNPKDLAELEKLGVKMKSLGDVQQISIDTTKAAAAAQEAAACPEAKKDQSDENSDSIVVSSK